MNKKEENTIEVVNVGSPNIDAMSEKEQRIFYGQLLTRIIELRKEQLEKLEQTKNQTK